MENAYIGLGSNLGDPQAQVEAGVRALENLPQSQLLKRSRLYRSAPWGRTDQPDFVNAAVLIETARSPNALMRELLAIERLAGRERGNQRWGPRVLDLDILLFGDRAIDEPHLRVPHPHLHERAFALLPLAEIAPALIIPGHGTIEHLLSAVDASTCSPLTAESIPAT
jgi:2-amino-4-hydroxy-6-hydroxymethyldihydropteridine diphosphokinase